MAALLPRWREGLTKTSQRAFARLASAGSRALDAAWSLTGERWAMAAVLVAALAMAGAAFPRLDGIRVDLSYEHDQRWGDGNGYAHVRASLLGASLMVPLRGGRMLLGTWQQIVVLDFDNRPRMREVQVQITGI